MKHLSASVYYYITYATGLRNNTNQHKKCLGKILKTNVKRHMEPPWERSTMLDFIIRLCARLNYYLFLLLFESCSWERTSALSQELDPILGGAEKSCIINFFSSKKISGTQIYFLKTLYFIVCFKKDFVNFILPS